MANHQEVMKHFEIAKTYIDKGQFDKAIDEYKLALLYAPDSPFVYYNLGMVYMQKNDIPKAIINFQRAIELKKDFLAAHLYLGIAYQKGKDFDKAVKKFNEVLEMDKNIAEAYLHLGEVHYYRTKANIALEMEQAEECFKKVLELNPDNIDTIIDANMNLGKIYLDRRMIPEAQQYFNKADELKRKKETGE